MRTHKVDQRAARAIHRTLILNELRRHGPLTRTQLAAKTRLSVAAVSLVTGELLNDALLIEHSHQTSRGRAIPLDIHYTGHFTVGLKVMETQLEAVLTDLSLRVLAETEVDYAEHSPETVTAAAAQATAQLLAAANLERNRLSGIGLGLPGAIDPLSGVCLSSHRLNWWNVPITQMISDITGVPVWADNDVHAFTTAERLLGRGKHARNFLVVTLGRGIGAGLVLGGELYRGSWGGAGELGHLLSEPEGLLCECGKRGCLEAYASEPGLSRQLGAATSAELMALLGAAQPATLAVVAGAGERLGRALAQSVNLLDPELLIVGGEGVRLGEAFFGPMRAALLQHRHATRPLPVLIEPWGNDAWACGAAGLVVEQFFREWTQDARAQGPPAQTAPVGVSRSSPASAFAFAPLLSKGNAR